MKKSAVILIAALALQQAFLLPTEAGTPLPGDLIETPAGRSPEDAAAAEAQRSGAVANRNLVAGLADRSMPATIIEVPSRGYAYNVSTKEFTVITNGQARTYKQADFIRWFMAGQAMLRFASEVNDAAQTQNIIQTLNAAMGAEHYVSFPNWPAPAFGKYGKMYVITDQGSGYSILNTSTGVFYVGNYTPEPGLSYSKNLTNQQGQFIKEAVFAIHSLQFGQQFYPASSQQALAAIGAGLKAYLGIDHTDYVRSANGNVTLVRAYNQSNQKIYDVSISSWPYINQVNVYNPATGTLTESHAYHPNINSNPLMAITTYAGAQKSLLYFDTNGVRSRREVFSNNQKTLVEYFASGTGALKQQDYYTNNFVRESRVYNPATGYIQSITLFQPNSTKPQIRQYYDSLGRLERLAQYNTQGILAYEYYFIPATGRLYKFIYYVNGVGYVYYL